MHHINYRRINSVQLAAGSSETPKDYHSRPPGKATDKRNTEMWDADVYVTSLKLEEKVSPKTEQAFFLSGVKEHRRSPKHSRDGHHTERERIVGRTLFIFSFAYLSREDGSYWKLN